MAVFKRPENIYNIVIPAPTDDDRLWAEKIDKKGFSWRKTPLRKLVEEKQLWRLNYVLETCQKGFSKEKLNRKYFSSTYPGESLLGRAIQQDSDDMCALLLAYGAEIQYTNILRDWFTKGNAIKIKTAHCWLQSETNFNQYFGYVFLEKNTKDADLLFQIIADNEPALYKALSKAIECEHQYFLEKIMELSNLDLSVGGYAPLKLAQQHGSVMMIKRIEEKLIQDYPNFQSDKKSASLHGEECAWQKISDQEILYQRGDKKNDLVITSVFDFTAKEITRTHYYRSNPPAMQVRNFEDLQQDQEILSMAFNQLVKQGGQPTPLKKGIKKMPLLTPLNQKSKAGM